MNCMPKTAPLDKMQATGTEVETSGLGPTE